MTDSRQSREDYLAVVDGLDSFGRLTSELIIALMDFDNIPYLTTTHRVKSYASATRKLEKDRSRYIDYESVHDMLGLRIITYFSDDVDRVAKLVKREFLVDPVNSIDKRRLLEVREFGYLSLHYVLSLHPKRASLPEYRTSAGRSFELQVRSVLQHAWAEIEHEPGYKSSHLLSGELQRDFARIAGLLETADQGFVHLRDRIQEQERRAAEEAEGIPTSPLTPLNALAFATTNQYALAFENFLAELLGARLVGGGNYTSERALAVLKECGIGTIEQLEAVYQQHATELREFAELWTGTPHGAKPATLHQEIEAGISVFYVELFNLAKLSNQNRAALAYEYDPSLVLPLFSARFLEVRKAWAEKNRDIEPNMNET